MAAVSLGLLRRSIQRVNLRQLSTLSQGVIGTQNCPPKFRQSPGTISESKKIGRSVSHRKDILCPTDSLTSVILDVPVSIPKSCPTLHITELDFLLPNPLTGFIDKEAPPLYDTPVKEAVDKIRRQRSRMNQHKLRRYRHENLVAIREHRHRKAEQKAKKDLQVIDRFRSYSAKFNAEEKVMQDLETARRGGFYVECYGPNREDRKSTSTKVEDKSLDIL